MSGVRHCILTYLIDDPILDSHTYVIFRITVLTRTWIGSRLAHGSLSRS